MRRDSPEAAALVALCAAAGVAGTTGRTVESWSHAGLLPPGGTPDERKVEHVRQLRAVHRRGPGSQERTILVLLARGYPCEGTWDAIIRAHGAGSSDELAARARAELAETMPDPESDDGSWAVDREVQAITMAPENAALPPTDRRVIGSVLGAAKRNARKAPLVDLTTGKVETPERTLASALTRSLGAIYGSPPYEAEVAQAMVRLGGSTEHLDDAAWQEGEELFDAAAEDAGAAFTASEEVRANLAHIPLDLLVEGAQLVRRLLGILLEQPARRSPATGEELDFFAGVSAPLGVAFLKTAPWLTMLLTTLAPEVPS